MGVSRQRKVPKLSDKAAEKDVVKRAQEDLQRGKSPTTAAGQFVREEIKHVHEGKNGARSIKQAIAIGLSKARRAGIPLPAPGDRTRKQAKRETKAGPKRTRPFPKRSRATKRALKREPRGTVSKRALSEQARETAAARD